MPAHRPVPQPLPDAVPAGIEAFRLDLDLDLTHEPVEALVALTPEEIDRMRRFVRVADRMRFAAARATTRRLLAERLGCGPLDVRFDVGANGKPFVKDAGQGAPLFNVSHSGTHAMIAIADPSRIRDVGIDIERCGEDVDLQGISPMVFTPDECAAVQSAVDPFAAFYLRWSGKEAVLKAIGVGITEHLQSISIHSGQGRELAIDCRVVAWASIRAVALDVPEGYAAALAWWEKSDSSV